MTRITRAASHLPIEEVKARLKLDPRPWCRQRWLIVYHALGEPRARAPTGSCATVDAIRNLLTRGRRPAVTRDAGPRRA